VRFKGDGDELDIDRTLELLGEGRPLGPEELFVREPLRQRRSVVLAVDVSGSMRGERVRIAAAAVGALAAELTTDDFAVVAFWSEAAVLLRFGEHATAEQIIDELLAIEPVGLTNVSFPLEWAAGELARAGVGNRRAVLLSDCVHNAGPDPRRAAATMPRLDVLFDDFGEKDAEMARDLARRGRGLVLPVRDFADVAPALGRIFED
jgi:uncharacterized protein with von Willebrand factor type A (vWA) domain